METKTTQPSRGFQELTQVEADSEDELTQVEADSISAGRNPTRRNMEAKGYKWINGAWRNRNGQVYRGG